MDKLPITVDIVIPFKRSLEYLPRLLQSLREQDYPHFSIIFVDDGSTDGSSEYLAQFAERSPLSVRIIQNSGSGPGCGRNAGCAVSEADYVTFVDSDDYVRKDHLSGLVSKAANMPDIVEGLFLSINEKGVATSRSTLKVHLNKQDRLSQVSNGALSMVTWGKLYRNQFLKDNDIRFLHGAINGEDHLFTLMAYKFAETVETNFDYTYYWCRRSSSTTNRIVDEQTVDDLIRVNEAKLLLMQDPRLMANFESVLVRSLQEAQRRRYEANGIGRPDLSQKLTDHAQRMISQYPEQVAAAKTRKPDLAVELNFN